jgi:ribosomal protein L37AE/L43A
LHCEIPKVAYGKGRKDARVNAHRATVTIADFGFEISSFLNPQQKSSISNLLVAFTQARYYNLGRFYPGYFSKESDMTEKRQMMEVCKCENCGNEAEMIVTCEFVPVEDLEKKAAGVEKQEKKSFTCESCGSEADMIIDL